MVAGVCLGVVFAFDEFPLTWIVLLPAIWAGLTMGPWTSAAFGLTVHVPWSSPRPFRRPTVPTVTSDLRVILLLDSLMAAFVFVVLLLSLLRDQRAYLAGEVVRRRQEAIDQAGLLGTVFESISDALVLMDPDGVVQLHNAAAAELLGQDRLESEPVRWLRRMAERAAVHLLVQPRRLRRGAAGALRCSSRPCSTPAPTASWPSPATSRPSSAASRS